MNHLADSVDERRLVEQATRRLKDAKRCPGCGRVDELHLTQNDEDQWYRVRCGWCDWCGPESKDPHHAVDEWNTREGKE